jgi:GNAT superfamily N-acetyltransferase
MSFSIDSERFTRSQQAEYERDERVAQAHRRKERLMELIGEPLRELTIAKKNKETGEDSKIIFFKIDPRWEEEILEDLIQNIEGIVAHFLVNSKIHLHLTTEQRKIQYLRHSLVSIILKLRNQDHPHNIIVALDYEKKHIRLVGAISIDPEYVEEKVVWDEYEEEYQLVGTGIEVKSEYVDEGYQGYGIGTVLLELALQEIHDSSPHDALVKVPHSLLALKFYADRGMKMLGLRRELLPDKDGKLVEFWFYLMTYFRRDLNKKFGKQDSTQTS